MKRLFRFLIKTILVFVAITVFWVLLYKFVPVAYTPLMAIRYFKSDTSYETKHHWKSLDEISNHLQLAVICAEDQHFLEHSGFDYKAIKKAYEGNKNGNRIKGGSTISQQTAKNVFLWPERNWFRKGLEAYFTFLIESLWSKERILEVYLNSVEMGRGVFGAEAASKYWFNKQAKNLTQFEAASIAAILPNPRKFKANPRTTYIEKRKNWIVLQMLNYGTFELNEFVIK